MIRLVLFLGAFLVAAAPQTASAQSKGLTLPAALAEGDARNPEIGAALRGIDVAQARVLQAAPSPLQLQISGTSAPDVPGGVGIVQNFTAGIAQQFAPPGTLSASRSAAQAEVQAARSSYESTRRDVQRRIVTAFYAVVAAGAARSVAEQNVQATSDVRQTSVIRQRAGAVGNFEVLRVTVELRRAQTDLFRAQAAERSARIGLNTLIGRPPSDVLVIEDVQIATSAPSVGAGTQAALASDPQSEGLRATIRAFAARASAAERQRGISIAANAGIQTVRAPRTGAMSGAPAVGASLGLPIGDYGTIRGALAEARGQQAVAELQLTGRSAQVQADVVQALADIDAARARVEFAQESQRQANEGLRIAQFGYGQGALGIVDVINAKNAAFSARGEVQQANADLSASLAKMQILLGIPVAR